MNIENYRNLFPVTKKYVFLNHAAVSPASLRVTEAVTEFYNECATQASKGYFNWLAKIDATRNKAAALINAKSDETAFTGNTSEGISIIAQGFKWKSKDAVLVPVSDFPANVYPWMHLAGLGVDVRFIQKRNNRFGLKEIEDALVPGTKMLAVSSVDYASGFASDLKKLGNFCREKGLLFCVDAIQSLGIIPIDVKECGIHFLASGGHKWLIGPMGIGILYVSKEVNELINVSRVGWKSVVNEENFEINFTLKQNALRFEPGTMNLSGIYGLGAAFDLLHEVGVGNINKKILSINNMFMEKLLKRNLKITSPLDENERSGILTFIPEGDPSSCYKFLTKRNIMVSLRNGRIRIAPHFYNNKADVDTFFRVFDEFS